ncbi:MAG TPA: thioredoxin domain-containing protein [Candidatus Saccharimonadales bacterium]|nr:thioredoxin domain-containing protein [Candidatus Saccharimonadales bacterium]
MDKRFWAIIGVIVVVFAGILVFHGNKSDNGKGGNSNQATNHVEGNNNAKVTLLEYGDYECPVCENYFATVQQVQQKYNDTVKFQFRNLPLSEIHPNAIGGARAAEAADLQGKFWQMHDTLYNPSNWNEWSTSNNPEPFFWTYAQQLGLNVTQFKKDFASSKVNDRIQADLAAFKKTGQQKSTPSFFVNGKFYSNANFVTNGVPSVDAFSKVLDNALKSSGQ